MSPEEQLLHDIFAAIPTGGGDWCACTEKLIPVGALAIWQDGVTHKVEGCEADQ